MVASALRGEFGNYHATNRTSGSELFINPLMAQYWGLDARRIVHHMRYADELAETQAFEDARRIIERQRERMEIGTATIARREAALPGRVLARAASPPARDGAYMTRGNLIASPR